MAEEGETEPKVVQDIKEHEWRCGSHGKLDVGDLSISVSGQVMCTFCSVNNETMPNQDIDPSVEMIL